MIFVLFQTNKNSLLNISIGVCLTHAALLHQAANLLSRSDDIFLIYSTTYWISGIVVLISSAIRGFCRLITTEPFTADLMLEMIEAHQVFHLIFTKNRIFYWFISE